MRQRATWERVFVGTPISNCVLNAITLPSKIHVVDWIRMHWAWNRDDDCAWHISIHSRIEATTNSNALLRHSMHAAKSATMTTQLGTKHAFGHKHTIRAVATHYSVFVSACVRARVCKSSSRFTIHPLCGS